MSASAEQWIRVTDPTTSAADLQALAAAEPELWPQIAAHPNVYPDLIAWMRDNGLTLPVEQSATTELPAVVAEAAAITIPPLSALAARSAAPLSAQAITLWIRQHARVLIWVGAGVGAAILALVLVMTLIVVPQQRAAEAAAAEAALLAEATDSFESASSRCQTMNAQLESALTTGDAALATDPATMADTAVLTALGDQLEVAAQVEPCAPPAMAADRDDIIDQTDELEDEADRVSAAVRDVTGAVEAVQRSVTEKQQAEAAAAAEAEQRAQAEARAARTWTMEDAQGYSFTAQLQIGTPTASATFGEYSLGASCGFDPTTDIAVPVTLTVTATTTGFATSISALVTLSTARSEQPHEVEIEGYYSTGPACKTPSYGSTILNGVSWEEPMSTGGVGTHQFVVMIRDWKTPATPSGDTAFLDSVRLSVSGGQNSGFGATQNKTLSLSNTVR